MYLFLDCDRGDNSVRQNDVSFLIGSVRQNDGSLPWLWQGRYFTQTKRCTSYLIGSVEFFNKTKWSLTVTGEIIQSDKMKCVLFDWFSKTKLCISSMIVTGEKIQSDKMMCVLFDWFCKTKWCISSMIVTGEIIQSDKMICVLFDWFSKTKWCISSMIVTVEKFSQTKWYVSYLIGPVRQNDVSLPWLWQGR